MNKPTNLRRLGRQSLAAVVSATLALGPMAPAYAATTALADVPIAAKVAAKPNIVYTVDDSGSMNSNFIPDFVTAGTYPAFCRIYPTVNASGQPLYGVNSGNNVSMTACGAGAINTFSFPPFYASDFNHLAYNPGITYQPPVQADLTPLTAAGITDAAGNETNLAKVQSDPYVTPATTVDLSQKTALDANGTTQITTVTVPVYCNSDWPIIGKLPYNNVSNVGAFVVGDVGDTAGEHIASGGDHCRINGTDYDGNVTLGTPKTSADYNYPWPKVGLAAGAAGKANAAAYFWRSNATRQLWCDKTNANWPHTCNGGWTCTMGGTYTPPATQPQTCYLQSTGSSCTASGNVYTGSTYTAGSGEPNPVKEPGYAYASCKLDPAYDLGGCVAGPEQTCLTCVHTTPCTTMTPTSFGACHLTVNGGPPGSGGTGAACNCTGTGCILPACAGYVPNPTNANCSKGVLTQKCNANAGACLDKAFDPVNLVNLGYSILDDSNLANGGTGAICRHNNFDYSGIGGPTAKPGNYPTGKFISPISSGCPTMPTTINIPRHYYTVSSVDFCTTPNSVANDQWNGFGASTCQKKNDFATHKYVKYGTFSRVDLIPGRTYPYTDVLTGVAGSRTDVQEFTNYANWYAYYRTRILAAKTTSAIAFSFLDDTYRVGFHDLGSTAAAAAPIWVDVGDFTGTTAGTTRYDWYKALFGIKITNYSTFTMSAMLRIGNLFETGGASGLSGVNPLPATAKDPIVYSCQSNYHILITDGFTNEPSNPAQSWIGEQDATVPAAFSPVIPPENEIPNLNAILGKAWPKPFVQQTKAVPNTLADIATYYWATDLRDASNTRSKNDLKNDVPAQSSKLSTLGDPKAPDVDPAKDVAWWQHVNFSAISFGSEGVLDATNTQQVAGVAPTSGDIVLGNVQWPDLSTPNSPVNPPQDKGAAGVDDLWHATVNARGTFVYAKTPTEVSYGLAGILAGISNQRKSRVGAAFSGQVLDAANNTIYESTIEQGWAGDLLKVQIDPTNGKELATLWQASSTLAAQLDPVATKQTEPWFTNRRVVTINDSTGLAVPFDYADLSTAQLNSLSANSTTQQKMIAYLRGGSTFNSGATVIEGTKIGQFRKRFGPMGDISNAQPVIVTAPTSPPIFFDNTDAGYSAFVSAQSARPTIIYAAANDGMLHAFDDATGAETFAFIPKALFRGVAGDPKTEDVTAIQALTYQDGGVPIYHHHMYVDSSPRIADVDFNNCGTDQSCSSDWHTILVGGLGKGGNSYYALDVTNASAPDEKSAAAKVLWEFHDSDMNYTYGRPIIVKTRQYGWVVVVTAGYNNVSGDGRIFFLDPKKGTLLYTVKTGVGSAGSPSGLVQINGFTQDFHNQIAEQIYGGDLFGNVWRVDVSGSTPWKAELFAQLTDSGGTAQPVTTAPQIEIDFANGVDRYVFVGTGQLLDPSDLTAKTQQQTMYAMRDGSLTTPMPVPPAVTRADLQPINSDGVSAIAGGAPNGWFHDLPDGSVSGQPAERIVVDPEADVNTVVYIGTQVKQDPCIIALPANIYAREYVSAASLLSVGGVVVPSYATLAGGVGVQVIGLTDANGTITLGGLLSNEIPGTIPLKFVPPPNLGSHRFSWRLLSGD